MRMERWRDTHTTLETKYREATASLASTASAVRAAGLLSLATVADEWLIVGSDPEAGSNEATQAGTQAELAINTFLAYLRKPIPLADGSLPGKPAVAVPVGYASSAYLDDEGERYFVDEAAGSGATASPWWRQAKVVTADDQLAWRTETLASWRTRWESASLGTAVEWEQWVAAWDGHVPDQLEPFVVEPDPAAPGEVRIADMVGLEDLDPEERWVRTVAAQILNTHFQGRCVRGFDHDQTAAFPQIPSTVLPLATDGSGEAQDISKTRKSYYLRPVEVAAEDWSPYVTDLSNTYFTDLVLAPTSPSNVNAPKYVFEAAGVAAERGVPWTEEEFDEEVRRAETEDFACVVLQQPVNLTGMTVYGSLRVEDAFVSGDLSLEGILVSESLAFSRTTVWGEFTASGLAAGGELNLTSTTVRGDLRLYDVSLAGDIVLEGAIVRGDVQLHGRFARVLASYLSAEGWSTMNDTLTSGLTDFSGALLQGGLFLSYANLGALSLRSSTIGVVADLTGAWIAGNADFSGVSFKDLLLLDRVEFGGCVYWESVEVEGNCTQGSDYYLWVQTDQTTWPEESPDWPGTTLDVLQQGLPWRSTGDPPRLAHGRSIYVDGECVVTNDSGAPVAWSDILASC
jgi:hypothetical protein